MNPMEHLERLDPNPEWLEKYRRFIGEYPSQRTGKCHKHHILPRSIFPEFESFENHPWNRKDLSPADHLIAHYHLFRARGPHVICGDRLHCVSVNQAEAWRTDKLLPKHPHLLKEAEIRTEETRKN